MGRTNELDFLQKQFRAVAEEGMGRVLLVAGEPGVGKTRLVEEFGRWAQARGVTFARGQYLRDGTPPYGPWVESLRSVLQDVDDEEFAQAIGVYGAELAQIFPGLIDRLGPLPPTTNGSSEEQRRRLYDGIVALIAHLSRRKPLALLLDDLQWAPSLALLAHLARHLKEIPILVICTYRDQEFREHPVLLREWAELNRARLFIQIQVSPFSQEETAVVIQHYFGDRPAAQLGDLIYRRTRGNAFFIEEVLRSLVESGTVHLGRNGWEVADPGWISIPDSIKLAVEERVGRLGELVWDVLVQAAVLGQEFSFTVLQAMTGRPVDELLEVLDRAIAARLLVDRSRAGEERYAFADDQVQEVLYESLTPPRRHRAHRQAGLAFERVYADRLEAHCEELARHFTAANEAAKAADYAWQAGLRNDRLFQWTRAGALYAQTADLLTGLPDTQENRRRRIDAILKSVGISATDVPEQNLTRLAEADGLAQALVASTGLPDDRLRLARVHYWLGRTWYYCGEPVKAVQYHERALPVAQELGDDEVLAVASSSIGRYLVVQGRLGAALHTLSQAIAPLERTGNWADWSLSVAMLGVARAGRGEYAAGIAEVQRALARTRENQNLRSEAVCRSMLAVVHLFGHDLPRLYTESHAAVALADESGTQLFLAIAHGLCAWAESRLGRHSEAAKSLGRSREVTERLGGHLTMGDWLAAAEAEIALNAGRTEEAARLAEAAVVLADSLGGLFAAGVAHRVWGEALARWPGHRPLSASTDVGRPAETWSRADRRWAEAEAHFAASLDRFEAGHLCLEAARTHFRWGVLSPDPISGMNHLNRASAQFAAAGLSDELKRTYAAREDLVVKAATRTRSKGRVSRAYPAGLTHREVEVLRLLAAGQTSKEIAAAMVLSLSTVERHIANIYAKTGARSRALATAYALNQGLIESSSPE